MVYKCKANSKCNVLLVMMEFFLSELGFCGF